MKAIRINHYGHSDQLHEEDINRPDLEAHQVLVKIHDAGVNPVDWKIREGQHKTGPSTNFPLTMGQDFAGEVVQAGPEVRDFKPGDRVFGFAHGSYAEYAAVDMATFAHLPDNLDFVTAAALPTAGLTAYQILKNAVKPTAGQKILVHGGAGAVGSFIIQIAKHWGVQTIVTASAKDKAYLLKIGANQVIDYKTQKFEDIVKNVDAVVDLVGGETCERSYPIVKRGGILVSTVGAAKQSEGDKFGIRAESFVMQQRGQDLDELAALAEQNVIKPRMDRILPLQNAQLAQDLSQMGQSEGKIVLEVFQ